MSIKFRQFLFIEFIFFIGQSLSNKLKQKKFYARCYAPAIYQEISGMEKFPSCQTQLVSDYFKKDFNDEELSKECLHHYEFMDANGKGYPISESCLRRNRFDENTVYEGQGLTEDSGDDYLNSAKMTGRLIKSNGEYVYKSGTNTLNGFIVITHAPLGNPEDIMTDSKLNSVCGGNKFALIEGKDCFSGNVKKDGKYVKDNTLLSFYKNLQVNKINYIIMLTNFVEKINEKPECNCKVKADKYFSFNDDEKFNIKKPDHVTDSGFSVIAKKSEKELRIIVKEHNKIDDILEVRDLSFRNPSGKVLHEAVHIHYKGWPDFGVPEGKSKDILFELISFARQRIDEGDNVLVHCTGGIGRSATFVASVFTSKLEGSTKFNLFKFITEIRKRRPEAVETVSQVGLIRENMEITAKK